MPAEQCMTKESERGVPLWLHLKGLGTFVLFEKADH